MAQPHWFTGPRGFFSLALLTLACSDAAAPGALPECTGPVTVTVGAGTTPTISWTPACRLFFVLVEDQGGGDQWSALSDSSNAIAPPVTYGGSPPGATKITPPAALQTGQLYHLGVFRFTGPGHEDGVIIGLKDFTP